MKYPGKTLNVIKMALFYRWFKAGAFMKSFVKRGLQRLKRKNGKILRHNANRVFFKNNIERVIFLGGPSHYSSIQVRCVDIARSLQCNYVTDVDSLEQIPGGKDIFICVKPDLKACELERLSKKGVVVWDIIDYLPSSDRRSFIGHYLVSTKLAYHVFRYLKNLCIIPQHHFNFEGYPNEVMRNKKVAYIGRKEWDPGIKRLKYDALYCDSMDQEENIAAYRKAGILINLRKNKSRTKFHQMINSGTKLINAIGFGIPSISGYEPAFFEVGRDCTIFCNQNESPKWIARLQNDEDLYAELRENCIRRAADFSLSRISQYYCEFVKNL